MKVQENKNPTYESLKKLRSDWGGFNPVTRVCRDKTKYTRKKKHKGKIEE